MDVVKGELGELRAGTSRVLRGAHTAGGWKLLLLSVLLAGCVNAPRNTSGVDGSHANDPQMNDTQMLARVTAGVVAIGNQSTSLASGFFVDGGFIVTNQHVLQQAPLYVIVGDKRDVVEPIASNEELDLAILSSKLSSSNAMTIASDSVLVGERVYAVGNPFGLGITVSHGIVSALPGTVGPNSGLLTDAPINAGNSGGPLINRRGEVVGVVTRRGRVGSGIGFATPAAELAQLLEQVRQKQGD